MVPSAHTTRDQTGAEGVDNERDIQDNQPILATATTSASAVSEAAVTAQPNGASGEYRIVARLLDRIGQLGLAPTAQRPHAGPSPGAADQPVPQSVASQEEYEQQWQGWPSQRGTSSRWQWQYGSTSDWNTQTWRSVDWKQGRPYISHLEFQNCMEDGKGAPINSTT